MNLSLMQCEFPDAWKKANIVPIHKKDDRSMVNNYRPISILPVLSKLMEKVIFKHVYNFVHVNNLLSNHQSGFRPNDSTVNQLAYLYHTFCKALDNKKEVRLVFCDVSKAFDKVWHDGLLYKLNKIGISGNLLLWFKNYLCKRQQRVSIRTQSSEWGHVQAGVPQGSVLGPLLFLIYINDMVDNITCPLKLFADDTLLYVTADDSQAATSDLNRNLEKLQEWSNQWLVNFNANKTKTMILSKKQQSDLSSFPVVFNTVHLDTVANHRHLGVIMNAKLQWTPHIDIVLDSVTKLCDVFKKLKRLLDRQTLNIVYFTFVRPKLEYASILWDDCSEDDKTRVESMQLNFARAVTGAKRGTSHQLIYNETEWPLLSDRRYEQKLKFMYKLVHGIAPSYLTELLPDKISNTVEHDIRNRDDFRTAYARTTKFKNSIINDSVRLWNDLSNDLKMVCNFADFKRKIATSKKQNLLYNGFTRVLNLVHAQLRMQCSNLNDHLYKLHVVESPMCRCSYRCEDSDHFFFHCPLYNAERIKLLQAVETFCDPDVNILLFGSAELEKTQNETIVKSVELYILETERLL